MPHSAQRPHPPSVTTSVPRIVRAAPRGAVSRPEQHIPVVARIRWHHGPEADVLAIATAWTREAVEITWEVSAGSGMRSDWIPAADVRRSLDAPDPAEPPPHTRAGRPRNAWGSHG